MGSTRTGQGAQLPHSTEAAIQLPRGGEGQQSDTQALPVPMWRLARPHTQGGRTRLPFRLSLHLEIGPPEEQHEYSEISSDTEVAVDDEDEGQGMGFRGMKETA